MPQNHHHEAIENRFEKYFLGQKTLRKGLRNGVYLRLQNSAKRQLRRQRVRVGYDNSCYFLIYQAYKRVWQLVACSKWYKVCGYPNTCCLSSHACFFSLLISGRALPWRTFLSEKWSAWLSWKKEWKSENRRRNSWTQRKANDNRWVDRVHTRWLGYWQCEESRSAFHLYGKKPSSVVESSGTVLSTGNFGKWTACLTKEHGM